MFAWLHSASLKMWKPEGEDSVDYIESMSPGKETK